MNFDHYNITPPNPIFLRLGSLQIHWYAISILTGVVLALLMAIREGKKKGFESELFIDLVGIGLPVCILGARLYWILFNNPGSYLRNPGRILGIYPGGFDGLSGLAIHGGIIAAILYASWYLKRKKIPLLPILDIAAIGFFIGQMIGRFGNFMNQEVYGRVVAGATLDAQREFLTSVFIPEFIVNGMFINGNYHHPAFLYEALWNLVGLLIAIFVLRRLSNLLVGEIAAFYAIWYSFGRFFIEALRTDNLMIGPLRVAQVISIATIVAVAGLVVIRRKNEKERVPYKTFYLQEQVVDAKEARRQAYLDKQKKSQKGRKS